MVDPVPISEAARELDLSPARVRAMAARGQLSAVKIGDRWLVERSAVERRRLDGAIAGRRFTARNAWAILLLASGEELDRLGLSPSARSRLKRGLALEGLRGLGPRLERRADVSRFDAHPGELSHLLADPALMRSGISAAATLGLDLLQGREADGYLAEAELRRFVESHALAPAGPDGNVRLRVVPDEAWEGLRGRPLAPAAAVALDLAEEPDSRSKAAGRRLLRDLDRGHR